VAVAYFTAQSRLHIVINCLGLPETDQNMPYLFPYHRPVPNSAKFRKNIEIPRMGGKFRGLAQNSVCRGKL